MIDDRLVHLFARSGYSNTRAVPGATREIALVYVRNEVIATWEKIPAHAKEELKRYIENREHEALLAGVTALYQKGVYPIKLVVAETRVRNAVIEEVLK